MTCVEATVDRSTISTLGTLGALPQSWINCVPPTIFTGEGCVLAERISHHRTSRDSSLLQNCYRFCRVCSTLHIFFFWSFPIFMTFRHFMPGDETTTTTTKKVVSEYAKPAWHEIVKPTAQKPFLGVIVDRRSSKRWLFSVSLVSAHIYIYIYIVQIASDIVDVTEIEYRTHPKCWRLQTGAQICGRWMEGADTAMEALDMVISWACCF